jgi:hypothetical protein
MCLQSISPYRLPPLSLFTEGVLGDVRFGEFIMEGVCFQAFSLRYRFVSVGIGTLQSFAVGKPMPEDPHGTTIFRG